MNTGWHLQQIIIFEKYRLICISRMCYPELEGGRAFSLLSKITFEIIFSGNAYTAEGGNNFGRDYT